MTLLIGDATEYAGQNSAHGDLVAADHVIVHRITAAASGTITSLGAWIRGDSDYASLDIVVYADSAGTPGALLGYGAAPNPSLGEHDSAWVDTGAVSIAVVSSTDYWIGFVPHGGAAHFNTGDPGTVDYWLTSDPFDPPPSPWPGGFNFSGSSARPFGLRCLSAGAVLLAGDETEYPAPFGQATSVSDGLAEAYRFVADQSGTITTLSAWVKSTSDYSTLDLLVYAGDSEPGTLLGSGTAPPPVGDSWVDADVTIPVVGGLTYWLALQPQGGVVDFNLGTDSSYLGWDTSSSGASPFDPFGAEEGFDQPGSRPGFRGLGDSDSDASPAPGLEWHITGLWYPDAESVDFYGQIADPIDGEVVIPLNDSRTAEVTVSAWDPIVTDVVGHAYARCLKVYYRDHLVFWGPYKLGDVKEDDDGNPVVTLSAVDHSLRMVRHFIRRGDVLSDGTLGASNGDKGTLSIDHLGIRLARDAANNVPAQVARGCPPLGVDDGTNDFVAAPDDLIGITRGDEVWNTITELSQSLGPDFELEPIESTVGFYCQLNTYIMQGTDKTATVKLHYATGHDNLANLSFTEGSQYVTHVHVLDREKKYRFTELNLAASAETGQYTMWVVTDFDSTNVPAADVERVLRNYGRDIIKAYSHPLTVVSLTLPVETDADGEYHYLDHFDLGDRIEVAGRLGRIELAAGSHRITQMRLAQSGPENGVAPELTVVPSLTLTVDDTDEG